MITLLPSKGSRYQRFREQVDRISRNDPGETEILMRQQYSLPFRNEEVVALGSALQKSTHVDRLYLDISGLTYIKGSSTIETYLKSYSQNLQELMIVTSDPNDFEKDVKSRKRRLALMEKISNRLLAALQKNVTLRRLVLPNTTCSCQALSQYLSKPHRSLQVLELSGDKYTFRSELDVQNVGKALQQCHMLKAIALGEELPEALMVSILQHGVRNHPSLQGLRLWEFDESYWTEAVVMAFRQALESSTPQWRELHFYECTLTSTIVQPIMECLSSHPTMDSLFMEYCIVFDIGAIRALQTCIASSHSKLHTLNLKHSIEITEWTHEILMALQQNKNMQELNLAQCGMEDEKSITLVESMLRNHPQMKHLALDRNAFGKVPEATISFLKTVIGASSLKSLDCEFCALGDTVFERLASWSVPPDHPTNQSGSTLQTLQLSGNALTDDKGVQHLATFLQRHTPHLKNLHLTDLTFSNDGVMHLAKSLLSISLVELSLSDSFLNTRTLHVLLHMMQKHPTLKKFRLLSMLWRCMEYERVIDMVQEMIYLITEAVRTCQIHTLRLHFTVDSYDMDHYEVKWKQYALLQAIAANSTLTEVSVSEDILGSEHHAKLVSLCRRNSGFQKIMSNLVAAKGKDKDETLDVDHGKDPTCTTTTNHGIQQSTEDPNPNSRNSTIPLGCWAHILEAVDKQFPDASTLYQLLTCSADDLLDGWEERNALPFITRAKRDHAQISSS
jgi:Ran GTPase-activating protein (RanGAP) involved in mRNA processing and transport